MHKSQMHRAGSCTAPTWAPRRAARGHSAPRNLSHPAAVDASSGGGSGATLLGLLPELSTCGYRLGEMTAAPEDG